MGCKRCRAAREPLSLPALKDRASRGGSGDAVHQALPPGAADAAEFMAELISDAVFRFEVRVASLEPTSKEHVFGIFTEGFEMHDRAGPPVLQRYTMEEAEATLAQLVAHGLAEVDGDQITIPARFLPAAE